VAAVFVYCSSSRHIDPSYLELAAAVGTRLAAGGHRLVSGGGSVSMMGAVARATRSGGGHTTGVIPVALVRAEVADLDADELVVVDTMRERKLMMDERSDAFLALPGGLGTLEELFEVWTAGVLGMHAKPVLVLDPDGFYDPLWDFVKTLEQRGFAGSAALARLHRVDSVSAAFEIIEKIG